MEKTQDMILDELKTRCLHIIQMCDTRVDWLGCRAALPIFHDNLKAVENLRKDFFGENNE